MSSSLAVLATPPTQSLRRCGGSTSSPRPGVKSPLLMETSPQHGKHKLAQHNSPLLHHNSPTPPPLCKYRSMGPADVVGNEVYFWGGYCGGVLPGELDFYKLVVDASPALLAPP